MSTWTRGATARENNVVRAYQLLWGLPDPNEEAVTYEQVAERLPRDIRAAIEMAEEARRSAKESA